MNGGKVVTDAPTGGGSSNYDPGNVQITGGSINMTPVGSQSPSTGVFTEVRAGFAASLALVDSGSGYNSLTFNGNGNDGTRLGLVATGNPGDPTLYIDAPAGGHFQFRIGGQSGGTIDATGYHPPQ